MKKRLQLTLLFVIMSLLSFSATAHDFEVDGFYYNISDVTNKTVEVTFSGNSYDAVENEYSGNVVIPNTVTYNNIRYSVTSIGTHAFYNNGLTSVTIPNSVTSIGSYAFYNNELTSVTIPNSVTSIGSYAFDGCSSLTEVIISNSVTSIGESAFDWCTSLTKVYISDLSAWCKIDFGNYTSNPLYYAKHLYLNGSEMKNLTMPNNLTEIKSYAFFGCTSLTSVAIGDSVTSIGHYAFYGCTSLTSVTIGGSVTTIGDSAFFGCTSLTSVAIGDSVTSIGHYAFYGCTSLTSVAIGDSVTTIGDAAFDGCSALTSVTIPNSVTSIGASAFRDCTGLTSITIPNSVISIGSVAFYNCPGVTKITIGESVEIIGWETFGLDNTAIGYSPCLKQIISLNPTPPTCASNGSFFSDYYTITTLYVPKYCYGEYRADDNEWMKFKNIEMFGITLSQTYTTLPVNDIMTLSYTVVPSTASVEWSTSNPDVVGIKVNSDNSITVVGIAGGEAYITAKVAETGSSARCYVTVGNAGIDSINQDNTATEIARHDIHGRQLTQPASGINIIKMSDGTTRKEFVK